MLPYGSTLIVTLLKYPNYFEMPHASAWLIVLSYSAAANRTMCACRRGTTSREIQEHAKADDTGFAKMDLVILLMLLTIIFSAIYYERAGTTS